MAQTTPEEEVHRMETEILLRQVQRRLRLIEQIKSQSFASKGRLWVYLIYALPLLGFLIILFFAEAPTKLEYLFLLVIVTGVITLVVEHIFDRISILNKRINALIALLEDDGLLRAKAKSDSSS